MAYSKQNFQNGQILNAANLEAMENGIIAGQGAHNLLDNSDFTNPVNQRGATTATLGKYFIDRWNTEPFPSGPSITIDGNGLTLLQTTGSTAGIFQKIPDYEKRKGKIHTFAICVGNEWKCVSFTMGNFGVGYQIHGLYFFSTDSRHILIRNNSSDNPAPITIQRVALYEGSYTSDTLPAYQPKGYAAELAECRRYYKIVDVNVAPWLLESTTMRRYYVGYEPMRTAPTVDVSGLKEYSIWTALESAINPYNIKNNRVLLSANAETTSTRLYIGGSIALSADL